MQMTQQQRAIILQYRFSEGLSVSEIARRVGGGVTASGIARFCRRTQHRASGSRDLEQLLAHSECLPRSGRPCRVEPGSTQSVHIRHAVRTDLKYFSQDEAANHAYQLLPSEQRTTTRRLNLQRYE